MFIYLRAYCFSAHHTLSALSDVCPKQLLFSKGEKEPVVQCIQGYLIICIGSILLFMKAHRYPFHFQPNVHFVHVIIVGGQKISASAQCHMINYKIAVMSRYCQ